MTRAKESLRDFIERAVSDGMYIRIEANDMLPIKDTKENILNKVDGLYLVDFDVVDFNNITIRATYHSI